MIPGGYILQPRVWDSSDHAKMPPVTRELWHYLLRSVNHTDNGKYCRGTGFFSLSNIQESLCWFVGYRKETYSKPQLTKSLRRLCEGNMIETAKATRGIYVTVLNYDYYQDPKNYERNSEGYASCERGKTGGQTKNKNEKNEKNEKNSLEGLIELLKLHIPNCTPSQLSFLSKWDDVEKFENALLITAGSKSFGTRWKWVVDIMEGKDRDSLQQEDDRYDFLKDMPDEEQ